MTWLAAAYAAYAYRLFWCSLDTRPDETATIIAVRAAICLTVGPLLMIGLWATVFFVELWWHRFK